MGVCMGTRDCLSVGFVWKYMHAMPMALFYMVFAAKNLNNLFSFQKKKKLHKKTKWVVQVFGWCEVFVTKTHTHFLLKAKKK